MNIRSKIILGLSVALINSCKVGVNIAECNNFKKGHFISYAPNRTGLTNIFRNDSLQIETTQEGDTIKSLIKWDTPCSYELTYLKSFSVDSNLTNKTLLVKIIHATKRYYVFEATMKDIDNILIDTVFTK